MAWWISLKLVTIAMVARKAIGSARDEWPSVTIASAYFNQSLACANLFSVNNPDSAE
ncbi:hypothetical protein KDH_80160 [Dictyobacter sp. S3.2.2.5]|uniref:Uncharacterized protein n=1 Tax=Dictyobacter halimunensis TaxID=3026934 RepID=A0ABQ6G7E7_9CHLR|nr:hypothetical protein KDH_80160 [Dictyobacter sp. S3.2.2.5]